MSEQTTGRRGDERPPWLDVAVMILSPLSLITALLIYFAAVRQTSFVRALGVHVDMLEEASVLSYLLDSTLPVFFPLLVASIGLLLWLWVDRMLRRWVRRRAHLGVVSRISWVLPVGAAVLVVATVLIATVSPIARPYVLAFWPFVVALAVLVWVYGTSLCRLVGRNADDEGHVGRRWAVNASIGLLVSLLLFGGMDNFAHVVGGGEAARIIQQPQRHTRPVLLYSAQDLQLDPVAAVKQELPDGEHAAYRYRYHGLRLAFVDGDRYFLIGRNWRPRSGTVIILPRDGLRMEFPRRTR